jgi:hypothetical protein
MAKLNQSWSHSFLVKVRVIVHQNDKWLKAEKNTEQYRENGEGREDCPLKGSNDEIAHSKTLLIIDNQYLISPEIFYSLRRWFSCNEWQAILKGLWEYDLHVKKVAVPLVVAGSLLLAACKPGEQDPNHIKVGISAGVDQEVWAVAQKVAKEKYNLDVEVVTFNDFVLPNEALNNGDLDANAFQHKPYLDKQIQERGYKLVQVGTTFVYPIAAYSKKITSVAQLPDGAQVAVPNDPTNLGRSLLLQKQGLITLKDGVGLLPTRWILLTTRKS